MTGQEITSDFIIARLVGLVEVRPHPGGARQATLDAVAADAASSCLEVVRGADHVVGVPRRAGLDDRGVPVSEIDAPGAGRTTVVTASLALQGRLDASATRDANAGSPTVSSLRVRRPPSARRSRGRAKFRSTSSRAATDCEPVASQPAPESACSTRGAKTPRPTATTTQAVATSAEVRAPSSGRAGRSVRLGHRADSLSG